MLLVEMKFICSGKPSLLVAALPSSLVAVVGHCVVSSRILSVPARQRKDLIFYRHSLIQSLDCTLILSKTRVCTVESNSPVLQSHLFWNNEGITATYVYRGRNSPPQGALLSQPFLHVLSEGIRPLSPWGRRPRLVAWTANETRPEAAGRECYVDHPLLIIGDVMDLFRPPLWCSGQSSWLQIQRSGYDFRRYQIFWEVVGLARRPLSLASTAEELLGRESSGSCLEIRDYGLRDPPRWPRDTSLCVKAGTNFADNRRSLGGYSSFAD
jgi:hypothetical protein